MSVEKCNQILVAQIKRLTRPRFNLDQPSLASESEDLALQSMNKVELDGADFGSELVYKSQFGKVFAGETFSCVLSLLNESPKYAVKDIQLTVRFSVEKRDAGHVLVNEIVKQIPAL